MTASVFVLGATGHIGRDVLDLCLARGHEVTAFVRSPHKITRRDARLRVVEGDPMRADELARALPGHDVVISALGPSAREAFRPSTLMAECAASTVAAMSEARVSRLEIVSAAVLFPGEGLRIRFFRWLLRHHARDLESMEAIVKASSLEYVIARPPRLASKRDGAYACAEESMPNDELVASFRSVAAFLVDEVETRRHARHVVGLARPARSS